MSAGGDKRLVAERDPHFEARHAAAMAEATLARRYRAAYLGLILFVIGALFWALRGIGLF